MEQQGFTASESYTISAGIWMRLAYIVPDHELHGSNFSAMSGRAMKVVMEMS